MYVYNVDTITKRRTYDILYNLGLYYSINLEFYCNGVDKTIHLIMITNALTLNVPNLA